MTLEMLILIHGMLSIPGLRNKPVAAGPVVLDPEELAKQKRKHDH